MIVSISAKKPETKYIKEAAEMLKAGELIVYPTDTIYGLGCDALNQKAVRKIYRLKKRDKKKSVSIMCAGVKEISKYAEVPSRFKGLVKNLLPGPYTFVLEASPNLPAWLLSKGQKTIGVRVPNHKIALALVRALGKPIVTTSINLSGEPAINYPLDIPDKMGKKIGLFILGGRTKDAASTVIDLTGEKPVVLRQGAGKINFLKSCASKSKSRHAPNKIK